MIKGTPKRKSQVRVPNIHRTLAHINIPLYLTEFSKLNNLKPATYIIQGKVLIV